MDQRGGPRAGRRGPAGGGPGRRALTRLAPTGPGSGRIRLTTVLGAPPDRVWADLQDIASHVEWMHDAEAIRFTSLSREGVGTTFDCVTRVGPVRLVDRMEVTEWRPGRSLGIRHVGLVTGHGRFTLRRLRRGRTRFTWEERLVFPWWMGGRLGALAAKPLLRRIWRRNLDNLGRRFEPR
ncbi:MAG TPA: SRPBCC family protein [Acidimicrobiales bacterium]|nr:SRPBCC family protein [Acidimicrobiales bacterium]